MPDQNFAASSSANWDDGKDVESNWFKFTNVGDTIIGTLQTRHMQKGSQGFDDQWVYELKTADGSIFNVGISVKKSGTCQRLNNCKLGEIVGIRFDSEGEAPKKGFHPSKNLRVKSFGMDPNYQVAQEEETSFLPEM